ncbi:MAG: hypothetical protein B6I24_07045 [Bacteroidetes bacterium 4572_128]|nr:MAG: hypothetical protein B6I24_07045 [Bacteroidetes bacterium 4572_128]
MIELLLDNKELKEKFFIEIKGSLVFNQNLFVQFLEQKNYMNDSYTQYKNKVGLTINGKYLKQRNEIALVWPFKDCILEGGQSREEDKREEIFFNEILAQEEITQLLEPKVLTNAKIFDKDGEHKFKGFTRDAELNKKRGLPENTITDNLIIKGNNLLALHSLKKEFAGKVKLIYIDPPYNTGNDSFKYNDSFNESTWLTFMKNRIEVAKKFLKDDGVIYVSCDDNELAQLKLLMDNIDGFNYESIFHIKVRHENRILRQDNRYQKVMEHLLCYSKNKYNPSRIYLNKDKNKDYQYNINIKEKAIAYAEMINGYEVKIYKRNDYEIIKKENSQFKKYNIRGSLITQSGSASEFYELYLRKRKQQDGLGALYQVMKMGEKGDGIGYRFIRHPFNTKGENGFYYQGKPIKQIKDKGNPVPNYYDFEIEFNNSSNEGGVKFKNGKKPENFIKKIFEISNLSNTDIVLDFHLGSGSTAGTCHKFGIQYIGIEQMSSQLELSIKRLVNAIKGEQTKLSKAVNWQGGGSFTYFELKKYNQIFIDEIEEAKYSLVLFEIWEQMKSKSFLNYNVDIKKQEAHIEDFKRLKLKEQKEHLIELLDKNQLYVNISSINDDDFLLSEEEKQVSEDFYQINRD